MKVFSMLNDALLMPLEGRMDSFRSGVFTNGLCHEHSLMARADPAVPAEPEEDLPGAYIFGGYMFGHYGHFLLESLSRLYAIQQCKKLPLLFMSPNDFISHVQRQCFRLFGLEDMRLVTKPTQVGKLILSPIGSSVLPDYISDEQLTALGAAYSAPRLEDRKVWLSRRNVRGGGLVLNEAEMEEILRGRGWEIVCPEELPLHTQLDYIGTSRLVAGFDGSAFFSALLCRKVQGRFLIFGRRNFVAGTIRYMLSRKGVDFTEHVFPMEKVGGIVNAEHFRLLDPSLLLSVLEGK